MLAVVGSPIKIRTEHLLWKYLTTCLHYHDHTGTTTSTSTTTSAVAALVSGKHTCWDIRHMHTHTHTLDNEIFLHIISINELCNLMGVKLINLQRLYYIGMYE